MGKRCRIVTEDEVKVIKSNFQSMSVTWRKKSKFWNNTIIAGSKYILSKVDKLNYNE